MSDNKTVLLGYLMMVIMLTLGVVIGALWVKAMT